METMKRKWLSLATELLQIILGIVFASIGLKAFLLPNGFLDGGVTGVAILLKNITGVNISILLVLLSIPFLILSYFHLSKRITVKSIFSILLLAASIHLESFESLTDDKLLIAIFGGLFLGLGIGITIKNGSVLDGSEILGVWLNEKYGLSIGTIILSFNSILFVITAILIDVETALYSILAFVVTSKITDYVIKGFEDFIGIKIVSSHADKLKDVLMNDYGFGMTIYKGEGGFGKKGYDKDIKIIHSIVNRIDIKKIHRVVDEIDPLAFVVEYDVNHKSGGVIKRYLKQTKKSY